MTLQDEIDARRAEIRTDDYAMSIGEWISLYENGEIDIHPEFQRFFRWTPRQKTLLIESILLGIPIPPIFVSQRKDGVWDVVDGLQRLSTIFQLVGILRNEKKEQVKPLTLGPTEYLRSLEGVTWGYDESLRSPIIPPFQATLLEEENGHGKTFTPAQRLLIKRSKIHVSIILKESDERSKYDLFERLNSGGSNLTSQEARNCILVSVNKDMYEWLRLLADDANFKNCVNLNDRSLIEQYDMELVLRFLVFRALDESQLRNIGDLDDFLTKRMREMAALKDFNYEQEGGYFRETFELLANTTAGDSFRKYDPAKKRFFGGFLVSAFEVVALGVGYNYALLSKKPIDIKQKVIELWEKRGFQGTGTGESASTRISKVIPLGRQLFKP